MAAYFRLCSDGRAKAPGIFQWECLEARRRIVNDMAELVEDVDTTPVAGDCQGVIECSSLCSGVGTYCQPFACKGYVAVDALDLIVVKFIIWKGEDKGYFIPLPEGIFRCRK